MNNLMFTHTQTHILNCIHSYKFKPNMMLNVVKINQTINQFHYFWRTVT